MTANVDSSVSSTNPHGSGTDNKPMDANVNGTPFSVLLDQAVKMKTAQDSTLRTKYDSYPRYYQNSLFPREEVLKARTLSTYAERMQFAQAMKETGNEAFQEKDYDKAMLNYEMAAGIFKFIENTNPSFKTEVSLIFTLS